MTTIQESEPWPDDDGEDWVGTRAANVVTVIHAQPQQYFINGVRVPPFDRVRPADWDAADRLAPDANGDPNSVAIRSQHGR
jgi:hypothetical protein